MIIRWVLRFFLTLQYYFQKLTGTGAFNKKIRRVYLEKTARPVKTGGLKKGLFKYHVNQFHESSCSVATVATILNAMTAHRTKQDIIPVTQHEILEKVRTDHWKERMSEGGYNGRRGLPLETLGRVIQDSISVYGLNCESIEVEQAVLDPARSKPVKKRLEQRLLQFENKDDCLIVAHFDQGSLIPEYHIPHISPVGGYDPETKMVTILDVDAEISQFYQVPFDLFYKGLSFDYHGLFKPFGYGSGGYVFIQL